MRITGAALVLVELTAAQTVSAAATRKQDRVFAEVKLPAQRQNPPEKRKSRHGSHRNLAAAHLITLPTVLNCSAENLAGLEARPRPNGVYHSIGSEGSCCKILHREADLSNTFEAPDHFLR